LSLSLNTVYGEKEAIEQSKLIGWHIETETLKLNVEQVELSWARVSQNDLLRGRRAVSQAPTQGPDQVKYIFKNVI
jgi:hypothetical protein